MQRARCRESVGQVVVEIFLVSQHQCAGYGVFIAAAYVPSEYRYGPFAGCDRDSHYLRWRVVADTYRSSLADVVLIMNMTERQESSVVECLGVGRPRHRLWSS